MRRLVLVLVLCLFAVPVANAAEGKVMTLLLQSPAFAPNAPIPSQYTCEGNDISPPLAWSGVPEGTQSFALIVDDPDAPDPAAPKKTWVHWVIYNIPANVTSLVGGVSDPPGASEGLSDWGTPGWRGPCPPIGRHHYFFKLYALNTIFPQTKPLTKAELEEAMFSHVLAQGTLIGTYEHSRR
jgi:Raf kinase inhibitor-like YbhB/YbcL family protein